MFMPFKQVSVLKRSFDRALTMSRRKTDFKIQLQKRGTHTSLKPEPVKAVTYFDRESMGKSMSKSGSPASVINPKTTSGSQVRESRTSERHLLRTIRSLSQTPGPRPPDYPNNLSSERNTSSGSQHYADRTVLSPSPKYLDSRLGAGKYTGTVTDSYGGSGYGVDTAPSRGANSWIAETRQPEFQPSKALSNSSGAQVHTFATTLSRPSDTNHGSNGRRSRATERSDVPRLRSASQGLRNLGNTCYMNSILQCLAKMPWFEDRRVHALTFKDDLLTEFFNLMKTMQENDSETSSLDPYKFRKQIMSLGFRFSSSEQNDAHEFLLCLLSRLSKSLKSLKSEEMSDINIVADFCSGCQQNVIRFKECKCVLINEQPFFSLSLPLISGKSRHRGSEVDLWDCLDHYTKKEDVDGDALCLNCQRMQLCSIEASFMRLPKFLIIHLKRYDFEKAKKLEDKVSFPLENLTIKQRVLNQSGAVVSGTENVVTYDLIAVCNHYGSLRFGHYTADIKSQTNNWYNYSDSRVTKTYIETTSRDAYILFYRQSR